MLIKSIKIKDILSIEDAYFTFGRNGLVLFEGWNYDDNRANGAGKTAIFNALSFGLYDDLPRKITASEIVRKGCKSGYAEIEFEASGHNFLVRRERPKNVYIEKDGIQVTMSQQELEEFMRLSYSQFLVSMYTAQSVTSKFINLNDSGKKEFLLQLMNLDFQNCKIIADAECKRLTNEIACEKVKMQSATAKIDAYSDSLKASDDLQEKLVSIEKHILDNNKSILELQKITKPDLNALDADINSNYEKLNKIAQAQGKRSGLSAEYKRLVNSQKPNYSDSCDKCGSALDITEAKKLHEQHVENLKIDAAAILDKMNQLDKMIAMEMPVRNKLSSLKEQKKSLTIDFDRAVAKIADHRSIIRSKETERASVEEQLAQVKDLEVKISTLRKYIQKAGTVVDEKEGELAVQHALSVLYSSTGAPAYVLDSTVDTFNESIAKFVDMIWPNASYTIKTYKENSKGEITTKFSEELMMNNKERSIGSLSGGELRSLSLAIDFAVIDVLNKNFGIELNPIIMDEPFEGLDSAGREIVVELLERLSADRQIIVVDHASEAKAMFSKIIRIEKRNGISKIV